MDGLFSSRVFVKCGILRFLRLDRRGWGPKEGIGLSLWQFCNILVYL